MSTLYLGRIVAAAITPSGKPAALYRVSSRSFPNRVAQLSPGGKTVSIVPKPGHEADVSKNPYIAYNAARLVGEYGVLANGSQSDQIAEMNAAGMPVRDPHARALLGREEAKGA